MRNKNVLVMQSSVLNDAFERGIAGYRDNFNQFAYKRMADFILSKATNQKTALSLIVALQEVSFAYHAGLDHLVHQAKSRVRNTSTWRSMQKHERETLIELFFWSFGFDYRRKGAMKNE